MEIEIIPFTLAGRAPARLETVRLTSADGHPQEAALSALADADLSPLVLHSTSWRHDSEGLVLTYAAVVLAPVAGARPVWRTPLARGTALAPPARIEEDQVAAHALVHLAWLAGHDAAVSAALPRAWHEALVEYVAADAVEELAG
ncbi:MAG TPA: hypothetical protein VF137_03930 [Candidatus Dormibacteraeota bacterium]